jgi:hypothetical protein
MIVNLGSAARNIDAMPNAGLHGETVVLARKERELTSALDRSLVLEAMGIAHEVLPTSQGEWALGVAAGDVALAEAVRGSSCDGWRRLADRPCRR